VALRGRGLGSMRCGLAAGASYRVHANSYRKSTETWTHYRHPA
jgi:hypothetical protein